MNAANGLADVRVCEVCGEPATHIVSDLEQDGYVVGQNGKKWLKNKPHSTHYFCVNHKRDAIVHGVKDE